VGSSLLVKGWLPRRWFGFVAAVLLPVVGAAVLASGVGASVLNPCSQTLTHPFSPWLDPASYALVSSGDFESGAAGWALSGGASVVSGNESFFVNGSGDQHSLSLSAGGSATSPEMCIGLLSPTTRFFVRNVGSPLGLLRVDLSYTSLLRQKLTVPIGFVAAGHDWQPTLPVLLLANLTVPPLASNGTAHVNFSFVPIGPGAAFQIDDDYVDPYQGR
jgi:hypothetical protein